MFYSDTLLQSDLGLVYVCKIKRKVKEDSKVWSRSSL